MSYETAHDTIAEAAAIIGTDSEHGLVDCLQAVADAARKYRWATMEQPLWRWLLWCIGYLDTTEGEKLTLRAKLARLEEVRAAASQMLAEALAVERAVRSWTNAASFGPLCNAAHKLREALSAPSGEEVKPYTLPLPSPTGDCARCQHLERTVWNLRVTLREAFPLLANVDHEHSEGAEYGDCPACLRERVRRESESDAACDGGGTTVRSAEEQHE